MSVKVLISATLRTFTERTSSFSFEKDTVLGVLNALTDEYPDFKKALYDENGELRPFINIFVNDVNINQLQKTETRLHDGDTVLLLPSIAGGAPVESVIPQERRKEAKLDDTEIERFSKHLMLREIGVKGQKSIKAAKVLICGVGALGSVLAEYLAAAGVGTIGIADFDVVTLHNLQNQVLYGRRDLKRPKIMSAKDKIKGINQSITVETYNVKLEAENIGEIIADYDIVADATDNYKARYLINDACVLQKKPDVFAAIYQFEGQVAVFDAAHGPCYRCAFPSPPPSGLVPTCAEGGVISSLPGIIGSIQATEVLKLIVGGGEALVGESFIFDSWNLTSSKVKIAKDDNCPICGLKPSITEIEDFDYEEFCGLKQAENEIPVEGIEASALAERISRGDKMTIIDVREPHERAISRFPDAIVIPIGQLARRQKELDPTIDTIFVCREGKRSILAINTLREAGYTGPMYNLKGGIEAAKDIILPHEGAWL
ncbi:MAG: ThiF family adenylyltransferase [Treponema sp.]|nr:ThiF family adenylyltransferase [Treponema sp.]